METKQFYTTLAAYYEQIFPLNEKQVAFVEAEFDTLEELNFLDVGCATGQLANALCKKGALGIGIDSNNEMIDLASRQFSSVDLLFKQMDMMQLSLNLPEKFFDAIICFGNTLVHLESITQVRDFFGQVRKLLQADGKFIFQILNYQYVLSEKVAQLPVIENEFLRFERFYELPNPQVHKLRFDARLFLKSSSDVLESSVLLLPLKKTELEKLLYAAGFKQLDYYSGFNRELYAEDELPLVVVASV